MSRSMALVCVALLAGCADKQPAEIAREELKPVRPATGGTPVAAGSQAEAALQEEHIEFPNVGVAMRPPVGFVRSELFDGFNHPSDSVSIMVVQLPGPFSEMDRGFTAENMRPRGLRLIERQEREVNGESGFLVHFAQSQAGVDYLKWSLIYGTEERTTLITATYPQEQEARYAASLKSSVLSVRPALAAAPDPLESLSFEITPPEPFKFANKFANTAMYSVAGEKLVASASEPIFVVAPALSSGLILDRRAYADSRMQSNPHARNLTVESTEPITIDGLGGFESLAKAEDPKSGIPIAVYQVMLFTDDSYIMMQGLVGAEQSGKYVPAFQKMARSFKRRPQD